MRIRMNFTSFAILKTTDAHSHYHRSTRIELLKEVTIILFVKRSFYSRFILITTPYSFVQAHNTLLKQTMVIRDTSFDDLKGEIEHLKEEIKILKQNHIIYDHRLTRSKSIIAKRKNKVDNESINKKIFL
ncbi:hypothetical protein H5410_008364 [Solanum commersonii]|uniref:Uncharacterized protein n=1 Tax=Solanum commersonii TaxID=4109 RepID=A0A9J6AGC8_SOLCO|nr:hypothetical protein H5410_008364 [Solanum commersonii]